MNEPCSSLVETAGVAPFREAREALVDRDAGDVTKVLSGCGNVEPLGMGELARCKACHGLGVRTCVVCGFTFVGLLGHKLCSERCREAWRPQTVVDCGNCGAKFVADHLSRRFCSVVCKALGMMLRPEERKPRLRATPELHPVQTLDRPVHRDRQTQETMRLLAVRPARSC